MGTERAAAGAAPHDQRRRRLDRRVAADGAARRAWSEPDAPVFAVLGDGTFGFHMAEFETAVRRNLPFVAVVGTDARWNAEYNLQLRDYGPDRRAWLRFAAGPLRPGGRGARRPRRTGAESADELPGAIERSLASGKPACINVMIESIAAPVVTSAPGRPPP